jgi:hypothetical protein
MAIFTGTYDPRALELMTQVLETVGSQARSQNSGFVEDWAVEAKGEWSVMGRAVWNAVAGGDRDLERLQRKAIDELNVHRAKMRGEVVASSLVAEHTRPLLIRLRSREPADGGDRRSHAKPTGTARKRFKVC